MSAVTAEDRAEIRLQVTALNELHQRCVSLFHSRHSRSPTTASAPSRTHPRPRPRSVVAECYAKCVPKPRDGEMSVGEMACVDRCVPKYLAAHALVAAELQRARGGVVAPSK